MTISSDAIANGFSTLIGAAIGAMLAYVLQRRHQKSLDLKADLVSAHRLMFSILQQINTIVLVQKDFIYTQLKNPGRFMSIPAIPPFDTTKNVLELTELTFLLKDKTSRAILYDFYLAQQNYVEALHQLNLRSAFHLERLQPAMAASGIAQGAETTLEAVRSALGVQVYGHAVNATENCIEAMRRAFQKLVAVKAKVRPYLVERFKSNDFTEFELPETWGLEEPVRDSPK